jgi:hypothetical protein
MEPIQTHWDSLFSPPNRTSEVPWVLGVLLQSTLGGKKKIQRGDEKGEERINYVNLGGWV